jgi:16S rRNA U516 pseudouridylate synthase RsuA-like enzyme
MMTLISSVKPESKPRNIQQLFVELTEALKETEKHYRIEYERALDISDIDEFQRVSTEAQMHIRSIRDWRQKLNAIALEIETAGITTADPATEVKTPATPAETKISSMTLLGKTYEVRSWNEVFEKVCEIMLLHKPYAVATFDKDTTLTINEQTIFSYIQSKILHKPKRLSNGLWMETDENAIDFTKATELVLTRCGFAINALTVN